MKTWSPFFTLFETAPSMRCNLSLYVVLTTPCIWLAKSHNGINAGTLSAVVLAAFPPSAPIAFGIAFCRVITVETAQLKIQKQRWEINIESELSHKITIAMHFVYIIRGNRNQTKKWMLTSALILTNEMKTINKKNCHRLITKQLDQ